MTRSINEKIRFLFKDIPDKKPVGDISLAEQKDRKASKILTTSPSPTRASNNSPNRTDAISPDQEEKKDKS